MDRASYQQFYNVEDDPQRWGRPEMPDALRITRAWLERATLTGVPVVLELGCGMGALSSLHPAYVGLDFSLPALRRFPRPVPRFQGDMQRVPVRDRSVDFVVSWAAIEHVPRPDLVLEEVTRVTKPGGLAVLAPAWNVRPWAAKALPVRTYRELPFADRARKASIPLRNSLPWRAAAAFPRRIWRELQLAAGREVAFDYRRLDPELETYTYTDCDAFTSMDPHAAIVYFASRGWEVLSHPGAMNRMRARHEPVVVRRPPGA
jgi:SAM-dependent methyltransferase